MSWWRWRWLCRAGRRCADITVEAPPPAALDGATLVAEWQCGRCGTLYRRRFPISAADGLGRGPRERIRELTHRHG